MDSQELEAMKKFVNERGIRRLVHFSPQRNLIGMVRLGGLWPRAKLIDYAKEHEDEDMLAYVTWNDFLRLDRRPDCINLSISRINSYLFPRFVSKFEERFHDDEPWCVIEINPHVMLRDGVVFTEINAAARSMQGGGVKGMEGLRKLFCNIIVTNKSWGSVVDDRVKDKTPPCCPTSKQAEVLVPGIIELNDVIGIVFKTENDFRCVKSMLQTLFPNLLLPPMRISEKAFMDVEIQEV